MPLFPQPGQFPLVSSATFNAKITMYFHRQFSLRFGIGLITMLAVLTALVDGAFRRAQRDVEEAAKLELVGFQVVYSVPSPWIQRLLPYKLQRVTSITSPKPRLYVPELCVVIRQRMRTQATLPKNIGPLVARSTDLRKIDFDRSDCDDDLFAYHPEFEANKD